MEGIKWRSYDGRTLFIHEMTHEHISSLYHFMKYISRRQEIEVMNEIKRVINDNFAGVILPYRPPPDVVGEAEKLHELGMLRYDKENHKFNIIDENDEWIGEIILRPEQEIDETTGMFKVDRVAEYKRKRKDELMMLLALQNQDIQWEDIKQADNYSNDLETEEDDLL